MKKISAVILIFLMFFSSCKSKKNNQTEIEIVDSSKTNIENTVSEIKHNDNETDKKLDLKLNVYVQDVAANFYVDDVLCEKTKKRILNGLKLNSAYNTINLVNKADEKTDVYIFGTIAKQTMTKIDAQDVIVAYTINIVSSNAKTGEIIHSVSQTSDRSVEKAVSELKLFNGNVYLDLAKKYFQLEQFSKCIEFAQKAYNEGAGKAEAYTLCVEASLAVNENSVAKGYLDSLDAFNSKTERNVYLTGYYFRNIKDYDKAVEKLLSGLPKSVIPEISENSEIEESEDAAENEETQNHTTEAPAEEIVETKEFESEEKVYDDFYVKKILEQVCLSYLEMKDYKSAENYANLLKEADIENIVSYFVLSRCAYEQGDSRKAIELLKNDFDNKKLLIERSKINISLGLYEAALKDMERAGNHSSFTHEDNAILAKIHFGLKDYWKALKFCNNAISSTLDANDYLLRGEIYVHLNENQKAKDDFLKAVSLDGSLSVAFYERGSVCFNEKDFSSALEDFSKAENLGLNTLDFYEKYAEASLMEKEYNSAIRILGLMERENPEDKRVLQKIGISYFALGSYSSAKQYFSKVVNSNCENPYLVLYYAITLHNLSSYTDAISQYENAIKLFSDSKDYKKLVTFCETAIKECKKGKTDSLKKVDEVFAYPIEFEKQ